MSELFKNVRFSSGQESYCVFPYSECQLLYFENQNWNPSLHSGRYSNLRTKRRWKTLTFLLSQSQWRFIVWAGDKTQFSTKNLLNTWTRPLVQLLVDKEYWTKLWTELCTTARRTIFIYYRFLSYICDKRPPPPFTLHLRPITSLS